MKFDDVVGDGGGIPEEMDAWLRKPGRELHCLSLTWTCPTARALQEFSET